MTIAVAGGYVLEVMVKIVIVLAVLIVCELLIVIFAAAGVYEFSRDRVMIISMSSAQLMAPFS